MVEKSFRLRIVTPDRILYDGDVAGVRLRGSDGSKGVLPNHAPMMTVMEPGGFIIRHLDGSSEAMLLTDGFAEMRDNLLTITAEAGEKAAEIDLERAREAERKARELLEHRSRLASEDVLMAEIALRRALARQLVGERGHN